MPEHTDPHKPDGRLVFEATDPVSGDRMRLETRSPVVDFSIGHVPIYDREPEIDDAFRMPPRMLGTTLTIEAKILGSEDVSNGRALFEVAAIDRDVVAELRIPAASVKMMRETLALAQIGCRDYPEPDADAHLARIGELIAELDRHRPLGPDGKHDDRHTATCGCEDR